MILTGELIDATEALQLRLVNHIVPVAQLEQKTTEILTKLRELSASTLGYTRRSLDLGRGRSLDDALREAENLYLNELMKSSDALEGVKAFTEKRKPVWRHR
jgi:cyclohexa-1,5-dienecarbonyl-CoA hydratase